MKKKVLSGIFALALLATAGYGVNKSIKSDVGLSDLALANVEALAQDETSSNDPKPGDSCYSSGRYDADWPESVVCDNPCKRLFWYPGLWITRSYCPYP